MATVTPLSSVDTDQMSLGLLSNLEVVSFPWTLSKFAALFSSMLAGGLREDTQWHTFAAAEGRERELSRQFPLGREQGTEDGE